MRDKHSIACSIRLSKLRREEVKNGWNNDQAKIIRIEKNTLPMGMWITQQS